MTENSSADATQSRQAGFVRYCLKAIQFSALTEKEYGNENTDCDRYAE